MAKDSSEASRRGNQPKKRPSQHPFLMLEHRILDSPAFADLKPTSQVLIFLLTRQFDGRNNGHLQATHSWCKKYGIGSDHTLKGAIADLISRGLLYRTRSHGANGAWAKYALTWLPLSQDRDGLFLAGFVANAWRNWTVPEKKTSPQKLRVTFRKNCELRTQITAETAATPTAETAEYEYLPSMSAGAAHQMRKHHQRHSLTSPLAIRLSFTADRGHLRLVA